MSRAHSIHELVDLLDSDPDRWIMLRAALRLIPEVDLETPIDVGPKCTRRTVLEFEGERLEMK